VSVRDKRLTGLDFLRALACLLVFAHHTVQRLNYDALSGAWRPFYLFFNMGACGVAIFFLLSGFLLARPFWLAFDSGQPMPSLRTYAIRRAARIVPGYYAALTVSLVLALTFFAIPASPEVFLRYATGLLFVGEVHWLTLFPSDVNGPLWSIGMEVASYALLPFGLLALFSLRRELPGWRGRLVFVGVVGLALVGHVLTLLLMPKETVDADFGHGMIGGAKYWMPAYNLFGFFVIFALGALTAGLSVLWRGARSLVADTLVVIGLAGAAAAIWAVAPSRLPEAFGWLAIPHAFPFFHLGIAVALFAFPHSRLLPLASELAPIRFLAKISFGIYIWHFIGLELLRQFVAPRYHYGGISDTNFWLELTGAALLFALAAGSASWFWLEAPVLRWAAQFERQVETSLAPRPPPQNMHA
jgi:peptidoglycan/LPS O-acetylase OafA/YrhL